MSPKPPNIAVFLLDTSRADRFSCYENTRNTTPFLDSLMEDGTRYEEAYSTSIWSLPSYTSLFTGQLPSSHGVTSWQPTARNDLVPALDDKYQSLCVSPHVMGGGWGLVDEFDSFTRTEVPHKSPLISPDPVLEEMRGSDPTVSDLFRLTINHRSARTVPNVLTQLFKKKVKYRFGFWDDSGAKNTINVLKKTFSNIGKPFFLFTNFVESHMPTFLPREWALKYTNKSASEINRINNIDLFDATFSGESPTKEEKQLLIDLHDASLAYQDHKIKEFYEHLESEGIAENTVFVFLSDHGNLFGERGIWGHHADIQRNVCRVPLLIRYPWESKSVVKKPVSITALFDNLVSISEGERDEITAEGPVFVEYSGYDEETLKNKGVPVDPWSYYRVSCISEGWKLDWRADGEVRLHEIEDTGPDRSKEHPSVVKNLKEAILEQVGDPTELHRELGTGTDLTDLDEATVEHLQSMGYLVGDNE